MIELPKTFTSGAGGFSGAEVLTYNQVTRSKSAAVYERSKDGKVKDYEAFKIKVIPKGTAIFNGPASLDDEEHYPSNNDFGRIAYSFHGKFAKEAALNRFKELNEEKEEIDNPSPEKEMKIPSVEFTTGEFAALNDTNYITASNYIKNNPDKIKFVREERRQAKGKMSKIYKKV